MTALRRFAANTAWLAIAVLTSSAAALLVFGAITVALALDGPTPTALFAVDVAAGAAAVLAGGYLLATGRGKEGGSLHTNATATVLSIAQITAMTTVWWRHGQGSLLWTFWFALFVAVCLAEVATRLHFVLRVRRSGGVDAEARRIAADLIAQDPDVAHHLIAGRLVRIRDRSRLHWRLGEALSVENVALYEREHAARDAAA